MNILFVCHGNICRSPMAEFIFKKMVKDAGKEGEYYIESAAVSAEDLGSPIYPPAKRCLTS
ncbi:MAG: low molecular weight phosphotyrosine protein phosphatase, partial [Bacteroidales bacterium]|nr:low molecular weight phosphotyrosine protein phosphatase [Bacteroidales bacterium]